MICVSGTYDKTLVFLPFLDYVYKMKPETPLRKCPDCGKSKTFRHFYAKVYKEAETPIVYLSPRCNDCAGIPLHDPLVRARQLFYAHLEILISKTPGGRTSVCKREFNALKVGVTKAAVERKLVSAGLNPTKDAVERVWYETHTARLRRKIARAVVVKSRPAGRVAGRKRGDFKDDEI